MDGQALILGPFAREETRAPEFDGKDVVAEALVIAHRLAVAIDEERVRFGAAGTAAANAGCPPAEVATPAQFPPVATTFSPKVTYME